MMNRSEMLARLERAERELDAVCRALLLRDNRSVRYVVQTARYACDAASDLIHQGEVT